MLLKRVSFVSHEIGRCRSLVPRDGTFFLAPATVWHVGWSFPYFLLRAKAIFSLGWIDHLIRIVVEQHSEWGELNVAIWQNMTGGVERENT